ncbi:alkaline phosphatase [Pseudomonas sp. gcc21]|uniref:choice-of-anchor I family protein n=1 Tax=Pseudomonas sp. gcc21 TaxID=2726989 RepID=UPI0014523424|nr:choice-of-anchor I family protein [Pseudomonas sp. gcc21]QJD60346.1 alkaline phosphatase [Pseudomonas sp. gcc21]
MNRWILTATAAAVLANLGGCLNSSSNSDDDYIVEEQQPETRTVDLRLNTLGRYSSGEFGVSAAEIPAFDPVNKQIFVVNALSGAIDVLNAADPANPVLVTQLAMDDVAPNAVVNSVAWHNGLLAVAVEAEVKTDNGYVALFDAATLELLDFKQVGALPDMLTFTPDGQHILVANEGEPSDDYQTDPEGSIGIIKVTDKQLGTPAIAGFADFNDRAQALREAGVRIYGPGASLAQDMEPEYITVSADSSTAWVSLQENNAFAKVDIASATVTDILPLGYKQYSEEGNGIDASDEDGLINIRTFPGVVGIYHPDAISSYNLNGTQYIVSANEGDARAWGEDNSAYWGGDATQGFVEEFRVKHLVHANGFDRRAGDDLPPQLRALAAGALLNSDTFAYCGATAADPGDCREDDVLGRLNVTWVDGYRKNADGSPVLFDASGTQNPAGDRLMYDQLYSYGARSVSIWGENGELVWDSGDFIEQYLASDECKLGENRNIPCASYFNSGHDEGNAFDSRSDAKGPEPEGITVGKIHDQHFAFIGLERMGGIMVFDISNPQAPVFQDYLNTRENWDIEEPTATDLPVMGDLGPEGLTFVAAEHSPNGESLLIVGNEVSGTTAIYQVDLSERITE